MQRRLILRSTAASSVAAGLAACAIAPADPDPWGAARGYPTGWSGGYARRSWTRVGNYTGGFESMVPVRWMRAADTSSPLRRALRPDFTFRHRLGRHSVRAYLERWPVTGLLVARGDEIWFEHHGFARQPGMRFTSWSMAKGVTALLLGIAIDRGLVASLDDRVARYLPGLRGRLHGEATLRQLVNMSSGARIEHDAANHLIYPWGLYGQDSDLEQPVQHWNERAEAAGQRFNYNELCALTVGMVLRRVTGGSLADFAEQALWQPMGAEGDASWQCDSQGREFNCVGLAARLADWLRLGQLFVRGGQLNRRQILSARWMQEMCSWRQDEQYLRPGRLRPAAGYKAFVWHNRDDGSQPYLDGHHGQHVFTDIPSGTVLVHTAVDTTPEMLAQLDAIFRAAIEGPKA